MQERIRLKWTKFTEDLIRGSKAVHASAHMDASDRNYFLGWIRDLTSLEETSDIRNDVQTAKAVADKYKGFEGRMFAAAKSNPQ